MAKIIVEIMPSPPSLCVEAAFGGGYHFTQSFTRLEA
jgi:hypothetical protein